MQVSALEINQYFLRAITLDRNGPNLVIRNFAEMVLPSGIITDGHLTKVTEFSQVLQGFLKKNRFKSGQWVVTLPESLIFIGYKIFPNVESIHLNEAVDINASSILPGNLDDLSWGWQEIEPINKIIGKEIMIASIPKKELGNYLQVFGQNKIIPIAIEPKSCSMARVFGKTENTLIINIEGKVVTFVIIRAGFSRFSREIQIESQNADSQIKELVSEIRKVTNYYLTEEKEDKIASFILDGSGAKQELAQTLEKALKEQVGLASDMLTISGQKMPYFALVGAGIRTLYDPKDDASLSLLPVGSKEATEEKRTIQFYHGLGKIVIAFTIIVLGLYAGAIGLLGYLDSRVSNELNQLNLTQTGKTQSSQNQAEISQINQYLKVEAGLADQISNWSGVLNKIETIDATGIVLTQISYQANDTIVLVGLASSRDDLVNFRDGLSQTDFASSVSMPSSNFSDTKNINFTINIVVKKEALAKQ